MQRMTLPVVNPTNLAGIAATSDDARGPYGYGRPAHGSVPGATYCFSPGGDRTSEAHPGAAAEPSVGTTDQFTGASEQTVQSADTRDEDD